MSLFWNLNCRADPQTRRGDPRALSEGKQLLLLGLSFKILGLTRFGPAGAYQCALQGSATSKSKSCSSDLSTTESRIQHPGAELPVYSPDLGLG